MPSAACCPRRSKRKLIQQLRQRLTLTLADLGKAIEFLEWLGVAMLKNDSRTRNPVGAVAVDQMADHVECAKRAVAFVSMDPLRGKIAQHRVHCGWSTAENRDRVLEIMSHGFSWIVLPALCWRQILARSQNKNPRQVELERGFS